MGGRHGKLFNSLNVNFSLSRGEPRDQDSTERSLVHVHSGSLDSISTAVSLATTQMVPTHSSSLDNLHQPRGEGGGKGGGGSDPQCNTKRECGQKYMLLETSSVVSGVCADEERRAMMTQSLPVEVERRITPHYSTEGKTEYDGFSDNFVGGAAGEGGGLGTPQVLHRDGTEEATQQRLQEPEEMAESLSPVVPEIPPGLFQKLSQLSQRELDQLATFVTSTVEHSLQSSFLEKLTLAQRQHKQSQQQQQQQATQQQLLQSVEVRGERELLDYERPAVDRSEERDHGRVRRRTRKERPKSLPPPYLKHDCERTEEEVFEGVVPREVGRRRSRSHEDCYHHRCTEPSAEPGCLCKAPSSSSCSSCAKSCTCKAHRCHCDHHYRESAHARRKKPGKVDISLDDNCPGVRENRVRRKHHHHTICERCLRSLGDERPRQRYVRPPSPDKDKNQDEEEDTTVCRKGKGNGSSGEDVDRIGYLTLEELRTAALLLRRSVGHPEDETSRNLHPSRTKGHGSGRRGEAGASGGRRHHPKTKSKHTSDELCNVDTGFLQLQPQMSAQSKASALQELVFPVRSRTGRDTPETDMAVINLDMNSPHMLAPIEPENTMDRLYQQQAYVASDSSLNNARGPGNVNGSTVQRLYLYNHHHHYHHIITHSQP